MAWNVIFTKAAKEDLKILDPSQTSPVLKAIHKVSTNPLPITEGGYGKPLGKRGSSNLTGYLKIKFLKLGIRVIYKIERDKRVMRIVIISVRSDDKIYHQLQERINKEK